MNSSTSQNHPNLALPEFITEIRLARTPTGVPVPEDFQLARLPCELTAKGETAPLEAGQVFCRTEFLSLDPYMRSQIAGRHLSGPIRPGDCMGGETVSRVLASAAAGFSPGDLVRCPGGWRSHSRHEASELQSIPGLLPEPQLALSLFGMPGLTAWAGIDKLAGVKEGDVAVVSAATGGVGAVAGQLARLRGARVVGIAGSDDKCATAVTALGYHHCVNRRAADLGARLRECCGDGIDVYFDLVGGDMLTLVSEQLAVGARVVLCGLMAEYNSPSRAAGPPPGHWIRARASVYGLVVYDYEAQRQAFIDELLPHYQAGVLRAHDELTRGLENAPAAFCRLMRGENRGKTIVAVTAESDATG